MTLKQTIRKFTEKRKLLIAEMQIYEFKLQEAKHRNFANIPLDVIDLENTVNLLDAKQIQLLQTIEELKKITHL
jgi:hypothetical protein